MRRLFRGFDSWHYSLGVDPDVDVCVWALERDGPKAAPFDRHPDGDGALRAVGLDEASWRTWFERVVAGIDERRALLEGKQTDWELMRTLHPTALRTGAVAVGALLTELTESYGQVWDERKHQEMVLRDVLEQREQELRNELKPYRRQLPPMRVVQVGYPGPVRTVMPPATVVLGVGGWRPDSATHAAEIVAGAEELARLRVSA